MGDGAHSTDVDRSLGLRPGSTQRQLNRWGVSTELAAADVRDALHLVNMRARGMSDPEICEAFRWYEVPQRFQKVGWPPGTRAYVSWTADEDEELRRLTAAGQTLREIAAAVGRSGTAVAMRRLALGMGKPGSPRWTPSDDAQLVDLFRAGGDDESIGRSLSRSAPSIGMRRLQLGLRKWHRWGSEEDATLVVKAAAGVSNKVIATELGRSPATVQQRREALGLGRRDRGAPWTPQGDALLLRLRESGRSWREIGRELGRTKGAAATRAYVIRAGVPVV